MRRLLIILLILFSLSFTTEQANFCDGWKSGYINGYCYNEYGCITPFVPICPIPSIGQDDWQSGYNRGLIEGYNDRPYE